MRGYWLSAVRVINWHYLNDSGILPIGKTTLITGGNQSGKSTILDAIHTVLFVSTDGYNLANSTAGSGRQGGRDIIGYIRGKNNRRNGTQVLDGTEGEIQDVVYKRPLSQPVYSHVVAEFTNGATGKKFLTGASFYLPAYKMDKASMESTWWHINDMSLANLELTFLEDGVTKVRSLSALRGSLLPEQEKNYSEFPKYYIAKQEFSRIYGISQQNGGSELDLQQWHKNMNRCIAFTPGDMKNSDAFVRNVVLEKHPISIDSLEENVQSLSELSGILANIRSQQEILQSIKTNTDQYRKANDLLKIAKATMDLIDKLSLDEEIARADNACQIAEARQQRVQAEIDALEAEIRALEDTRTQIMALPEYQEIRPLRDDIEKTEAAVQTCQQAQDTLKTAADAVQKLADQVGNLFGEPLMKKAEAMAERILSGQTLLAEQLGEMTDEIKDARERIIYLRYELQDQISQHVKQIEKTKTLIESLRRGKAIPRKEVGYAYHAISKKFAELGITDSPKYLYELLDFTNHSWSFAAEAYVRSGTLFSIVVPPEHYRVAAKVLRDLPDGKVYGVQLIDTESFQTERIETKPNTLASVFKTDNPYARAYINYRYNHVKLCDVENVYTQKDRNGTYLTMQGHLYQNRACSRLDISSSPICGAESRRYALEKAESRCQELLHEKDRLNQKQRNCNQLCSDFKGEALGIFWYEKSAQQFLASAAALPEKEMELDSKKERCRKLEESGPFERLHDLDIEINKKKRCFDQRCPERKAAQEEYDAKARKQTALQEQLNAAEETVQAYENNCPELLSKAQNRLNVLQDQHKKMGYPGLTAELESEREKLGKRLTDLDTELILAQKRYNSGCGASFPAGGISDVSPYLEKFEQLDHVELPQTQQRTDLLLKDTLGKFRRQAIAALQANIRNAQDTLRTMNNALKGMRYGQRLYQFAPVRAAKGMEKYYDAIMRFDLSMLEENYSFFGAPETETEECLAILNELFDRVRAYTEERKGGIDWLDYRSYCEFGITSDGQNLDKTIKEFSGAEVQIPFYVILAASLVRTYCRGSRLTAGNIQESNSVRLMMIDESFNRMDKKNTRGLLKFITEELGLQVLAAAPPSIFDAFSSEVDSVLYMKSDLDKMQRTAFHFTAKEFQEEVNASRMQAQEEKSVYISG